MMRISALNDRQLAFALRMFLSACSIIFLRSNLSCRLGIDDISARVASISFMIESFQY